MYNEIEQAGLRTFHTEEWNDLDHLTMEKDDIIRGKTEPMDIYEYIDELDMGDIMYEGGKCISSRGYEGGQFDNDQHLNSGKSKSVLR